MMPANRWKAARIRLGLSQEEVASRAGLPVAYVIATERARDVKRRLALAYGLPLPEADADEPCSTGNTTSTE